MLQELEELLAEKIGERSKLNFEIGNLQAVKLMLQINRDKVKAKLKKKK